MVGGRNNVGAGGFQQGWAWVGQKKRGLLGIKQVQRRAQRRDVPEGGAANVMTLRSNVAT